VTGVYRDAVEEIIVAILSLHSVRS